MAKEIWECTLCKEKFETFSKMDADNKVDRHLQKHINEYSEMTKHKEQYWIEEKEISAKHNKMNLGYWIKCVTPEKQAPKLWECPICKKKMTYYNKRPHEKNRVRHCEGSEEMKQYEERISLKEAKK